MSCAPCSSRFRRPPSLGKPQQAWQPCRLMHQRSPFQLCHFLTDLDDFFFKLFVSKQTLQRTQNALSLVQSQYPKQALAFLPSFRSTAQYSLRQYNACSHNNYLYRSSPFFTKFKFLWVVSNQASAFAVLLITLDRMLALRFPLSQISVSRLKYFLIKTCQLSTPKKCVRSGQLCTVVST